MLMLQCFPGFTVLPERFIIQYLSSCSYFKAGGSPELVIQLLSDNYSAVAQTVNLLAEWLIQMGKSQEVLLVVASEMNFLLLL